MNFEEIKNLISECELDGDKVCVKTNLYEVIKLLKETYGFTMLKSITAVDLGGEIELLYDLYSAEDNESVIISFKTHQEAESVSNIFDSAKADENEIYDMFGIKFTGNEDLKRLYMPENWEGFPLRKDYVQDDTRLAWNDNDSNNT